MFVSEFEGLEVDDSEIRRGGPTYTSVTLKEMKALFPEAELFLLVGGDVARELNTWKDSDYIQENAVMVVVESSKV